MSRSRAPAFFPYLPPQDVGSPAFEAQRFGRGHVAEGFGLHGHYFHQIIVCERGGGAHRVGDEIRPMLPGVIDIITEGTVHDTSAMDGASGWMLLIRSDELGAVGLSSIFEPGRFPRLLSPPPSFRRILHAARAIAEESSHRRASFAAAMRAHLGVIFIELARLGNAAPSDGQAAGCGLVPRLITEIDAQLPGEITLDGLATSVGLTPGYLTSEVRRLSGRTAMQWVNARRIGAAQKLLVETDMRIADIAAAVGFVDGSHFARRFREEFGTSPIRWRAQKGRAT